jgi:hypothetical protein
MEAQTTISIGPLLIASVGSLILILLAIIGFGIRAALSRIDFTIQQILTKLEQVMTITHCDEHHDEHQKQHELEDAARDGQVSRIERDINGLGKKLENHIQDKEAHGGGK